MKKGLITLGILVFGFSGVFGQKIHTPSEILDIMDKSPVSYQVMALEKEIPAPDRSNKLNPNDCYRVIDEDGISTYRYEIDSTTHDYLKKAEDYFHSRKFTLARNMYLKALAADSSFYEVMTYIGQTYGIEGNFDKAIEWYKKTISLNYIDYMAHWFLADAYKTKGNLDKAVDEITMAMILNRDNPRIKKSFNNIYQLKKLKTTDWVFNPQIEIDSIGKNKVKVAFATDWLGYAMVKALWKYEPGYRQSMGMEKASFSTTEERECLLSLMAAFDKKTLKKHSEFRALKMAVDKGMVDDFIFYEIFLPEHPIVAYQLPQEFLTSIKNYVVEIRGHLK
jgi:tetratricopeptide (TPR) repeat protein